MPKSPLQEELRKRHPFACPEEEAALNLVRTMDHLSQDFCRLFSECRSGVLAVSDYRAGKLVTTVPIGQGVDGAGYDPASGAVFASNADGTMTVIHQEGPDQYHVAQTIETPPFSRNMGLDPTNHRIFVAAAKFGPAPAGGRGRGPLVPDSFSMLVIEK